MMRRDGFTLVELLAVIVILAIIMIIAIPTVLSTMQTAKSKGFVEFALKVATTAQKVYVEDATVKNYPTGYCYIYDVKTDLGLTSVGSYEGYVMIFPERADKDKIVVMVWDESNLFQGQANKISVENLLTRKDFDNRMNIAHFTRNGTPINYESTDDLNYEMIRGLMVADMCNATEDVDDTADDYRDYVFINGSDGSIINNSIVVSFRNDI